MILNKKLCAVILIQFFASHASAESALNNKKIACMQESISIAPNDIPIAPIDSERKNKFPMSLVEIYSFEDAGGEVINVEVSSPSFVTENHEMGFSFSKFSKIETKIESFSIKVYPGRVIFGNLAAEFLVKTRPSIISNESAEQMKFTLDIASRHAKMSGEIFILERDSLLMSNISMFGDLGRIDVEYSCEVLDESDAVDKIKSIEADSMGFSKYQEEIGIESATADISGNKL